MKFTFFFKKRGRPYYELASWEALFLSLYFGDCPDGYRDKWECHFSVMEDTNKELRLWQIGHKPEFTLYKRVS